MLRYPTQLVSARRAIYDDGGRPYLILVNRRSNVCRVQMLKRLIGLTSAVVVDTYGIGKFFP